jgi:hypothetical protein
VVEWASTATGQNTSRARNPAQNDRVGPAPAGGVTSRCVTGRFAQYSDPSRAAWSAGASKMSGRGNHHEN